jgi:hypothetical protein
MIEIVPNWHPIWVKLTVGLLWASAVFYAGWALWPRSPWWEQWRTAARWMLWAGALATVATLISGFIAYDTVLHDGQAHPVDDNAPQLGHRHPGRDPCGGGPGRGAASARGGISGISATTKPPPVASPPMVNRP